MVNKVIFLLMLWGVSILSHSQIKLNLDGNCSDINAIIFSKYLINMKGKEFVLDLLERDFRIQVFADIDSLGYISSIKKVRSNKKLTEKFEEDLKLNLKTDSLRFFICFVKSPGLSNEESLALIKQDLFTRDNPTHIINIGFPGNLMIMYRYERDKAKKEGLCLSKYDYLLSMIDKYKQQ